VSRTRTRSRIAGGLSAAVATCALALAAPQSASAHATLLETRPARDAVVQRTPDDVVLRFDEAVSTVPASVRVFDDDVNRVDDGDVEKPTSESVSVGLPAGLPAGTYTVAWRVLSADSHPIHGAFVFSVGRPSGDAAGVIEEVLDADAGSAAVDRSLTIVRFVGLALILLCVGGAAVLTLVVEPGTRQRWSWLTLVIAAVVLAVDSLAWIALTGVKAAGFGLDAVLRWSPARVVLETGFGQVWLARAVLALALAVVAILAWRRPSDRYAAPLLFLASAIAVTPSLSGHARVEGPLAVASDAIHVAAAGVWVGGLAFIVLVLLEAGGDRWSLASTVVPRFSTLAVWSVAALIAAGLVSGFLEVRSWHALWHTTYGQLLLVKVALLIPLLALGAFNNRISVPRLRTGAGSRTRRRFSRSVGLELALMVAIVGVTAVLVSEPPARAQATTAPVSREGRVGPYDFTVTVDPAGVGSNEIHVYVFDSTGQPAAVDEISVSASLPAIDLGPIRLEATRAGPGHAIAAGQLPLRGDWRLEIAVRRGEFDEWSSLVTIPIRRD
jgi:copper transport protein